MSNTQFSRSGRLWIAGVLLAAAPLVQAETGTWTLEASLQRAIDVAPETRAADARVGTREGELRQTGAWPNPTIEVRADDKLGQEDGRGGADLMYAAVSQPLALARLSRQRRVAEANLAGARASRRERRLELEHRVAQDYHMLQLAAARLAQANERRATVEAFVSARERGPVVRYLAPAERLRLDILHEQANQAVAVAEGEYTEVMTRFRALLALGSSAEPRPMELASPPPPPPLETLLAGMENHPALTAARQEQEAARANIDAARSQRFADPALTLFRERDFINGARRNVSGVGLSVQIPFWNVNDGGVVKARYEADIAQAQLATLQRDLDSRLRKSHLHLGHLIEQTEHYRTQVLEPSRRLFEVTRRSYAAGEANVLALVDAHDNYFGARARYLELLARAWLEAADLRLAAGEALLADKEVKS